MTIEIVDLPVWAGGLLAAEYASDTGTMRVNARAVERVRAALGDDGARRFVIAAIAHECFHHTHPFAGEQEAHAAARLACGVAPERFEAVLRTSGS